MSILARLISTRATPENPTFNLNDPTAWDSLGAEPSTTGVRVTRKKALGFSPVWRAHSLISRYIAKVPLVVYKRLPGGGKDRATEHPAYPICRYKPNSEMTAAIWQQAVGHQVLGGNHYSWIMRDGSARPLEMIPLNPEATYPVRYNGVLWYITTVNGVQIRLKPEDVLHVKGMGFDGLCGYDVLQIHKDTIGGGIATRDYGARFYRNNAEPRVVLEHPGHLGDEAIKNLIKYWNSMHQGLENAHKTAVLEEGMKAHPFEGGGAKNAQLVESRRMDILDVANIYNLPPHKLGDNGNKSYASLEQANQELLDDGIDPWLVIIEQECRDKLLTEQEKREDSFVIEFLRNALVRADIVARGNYYRLASGGRAWQTPDEIRNMENLNPMGGEAAELKDPANIMGSDVPGSGGDGSTTPAPQPPPANNANNGSNEEASAREARMIQGHNQILRDALSRMMTRIGVHARKAAGKPLKFDDWLNKLEPDHRDAVQSALMPVMSLRRAPSDDLTVAMARMFSSIRGALAGCEDVPESQFAAEVDRTMAGLEKDLPVAIANDYFPTPPTES